MLNIQKIKGGKIMKPLKSESVKAGYRYEGDIPNRCVPIAVINKSVKEIVEKISQKSNPAEASIINAPTGTGKTTACMKSLIPMVKEMSKNILFVFNRTGPKEEQKRKHLKDIHSDDLRFLAPSDLEEKIIFGNVGFINYQKLPSFLYNPEHKEWCENLAFVIFDEAHFFTADSLFNEDCERILKYATSYFCKAIRIYLTATDEDVLEPLVDAEINNYFSLSCPIFGRRMVTRYTFPADYSRHQLNFFDETGDLIKQINDSGTEKWLIFVSNKDMGKNLATALPDISEYIDADSKGSETWLNLITNERFEKQVLITTSVLDCGANICDDEVKNIAIFTDNKTNFIQCIGRKRLKPNDKVKLWVHNLQPKYINSKIQEYKSLLRWFEKYDESIYDDTKKKFKHELWYADDIVRKNLFGFKYDKIYPKDTARFYLQRQVYTLSKMQEDGNSFRKTVASWLGKSLDFDLKRKELDKFCKTNLNHLINDEAFSKLRALIVEAYKEAGFKEAQTPRNDSMKVVALNQRLTQLESEFRIIKLKGETSSDSNLKIECWTITNICT